ncbi:SusC/RagA family TonB-linked outer membrane protein [Catalinimonas niigatensis]|uniref:SusC/RagA family TonB-linked outer membrane protein n=1 Tax=Catalinimonas niigatensis TaxID=1397264 RepID=UPI002665BAAF|nr:TonB-dependent receptor [Catalinimonas niigatensis]WPP51907.1 TonB-dependent receptor [Catalinimonas niigatensis]
MKKMKNYYDNYRHFYHVIIIFLMIFICCPSIKAEAQNNPVFTYNWKDPTHNQQSERYLKDVLSDLESRFQVHFSYLNQIIEGKKVKGLEPNLNEAGLDNYIKKMLTPLDLTFDRVSKDQYIIYTKEQKKKKIERIQVEPSVLKDISGGASTIVPLQHQKLELSRRRVMDVNVRGRVLDQNSGEPLPGVNVIVKETTIGTVTNIEGEYNLNVPDGYNTLVFSSVGYAAQEITMDGRTVINMELQEDVKSLSEVVVTGYTAQARRNITSAVSTIAPEELTSVPATNLAQQLQGRAAGVTVGTDNTPGGGVAVRIRGYGTLGNNDPLYVIDGVPTKGNLNTINQNDIESIQILKDASSASIYGSRAANGVVIITTKKGKAGTPKITFDTYYGMQRAGKMMDLLNTREYGEYLWQSKRNANVVNPETGNPEHAQFGDGAEPVIPDYIVPDGAFEGDPRVDPNNYSIDRFTDPAYGQTKFAITRANKEGTNWMEEVFNPAPIQNYQLGASGGSEMGRYAFSANYFNQEGILLYNGYKRYTVRANTEFTIKDRIRIGENLQIGYGQRQGDYSNHHETSQVSNTYRAQPIIPVYDIAGNFAGTLGSNLGNANNPVGQLYRNKDNGYKELRLFGNAFVEVDILDNLSAKTSFGLDGLVSASKYYDPVEVELAHAVNVNSLSENRSYNYSWTWTNTLTYDKTFANVHHFTAFAGLESIEGFGEGLDASRQGFFSDALDLHYLEAGTPTTANNNGFAQTMWSLFSYFGRIDYSFKDKYLLQATVRRDASSRFLAATRYATFPSLSAGWRLSEETFMSGLSFLDDLKLRVGWGQTGNQEIGDFNAYSTYHSNPRTSGYSMSGSPTEYSQGFDIARFGNPNAKWETNTTINLGIDATLFNNSLDLSVDVYDQKTEDLLYARAYDPRLGDAVIPAQNIASMQNRGIDLALNYLGSAVNGELTYNLGVNISTYQNKILELDPDNAEDFLPGFGLRTPPVTRSIAGRPLSSFYGYIVDGIMQSEEEVQNHASFPGYYDSDIYIDGERMQGVGKFKYRDINNDGVINSSDQDYIGNPHPDFTYGINLNVSYHNFDLTVFGQGVQGNDLFNHVRYWTDFEIFQGNRSKRMLYDSWRPDNPDAKLPILDANDAQSGVPSTYFIEDGSYLRLKNIQLGYTFPHTMTSNIGMDQLRVYIQAQNLLTVTNYSGLDPEVNLRNYNSGSDREIGVDQGVYPTPKSFIVGLSVSF